VATDGPATSSPVSLPSLQHPSSKTSPTPQTPTTSLTRPPSSSPSPSCSSWPSMSSTGRVRCYESAVPLPRSSRESGTKTVVEGSALYLGCTARGIIRLPWEARRRGRDGEVLYGVRATRVSRGYRGPTRARHISGKWMWKWLELASISRCSYERGRFDRE
jgi:hypothetical protein